MPAKRRVAHPNVQPGDVDARNVVTSGKLHQRVGRLAEVVKVPRVLTVGGLLWAQNLLAWSTEGGAEFAGRDIRCVLNARTGPHIVLHHVPIPFLEPLKVALTDR